MKKIKLELLTDYYEFTMGNSLFDAGMKDVETVFDIFFRKNPLGSGYGIMSGVDDIIDFIKDFKFDEEDIDYLRSKNTFSEEFLTYLQNLKFSGSIYAVKDGTPVFKGTPIVTVKAPIIEAQILETILLVYANANICFATAARRVVEAARPIVISEFGARRSLGVDAAVKASKNAYMVGCGSTSNVAAGFNNDVPLSGTMAHSYVEFFPTELDAFKAYADTYPDNCTLLVDTYNVLGSGIPNAIKTARYLETKGYRLKGIRIDSGDLAYLTKEARKMLDNAGLADVKICVSNGLKESTIKSLKNQGACIDFIGLGDNIVLPDYARVGCVYKLVAVKQGDKYVPRIKVSDDDAKAINPGYKKLYRLYDKDSGYALADLIALYDEDIPQDEITLIDPTNETNVKTLTNYVVEELQVPIFIEGKLVYNELTSEEKRKYCDEAMATVYPEIKREENPQRYYVNLSKDLLTLKKKLMLEAKARRVQIDEAMLVRQK